MKGTSMKKVLATLCSLILAGVMLSACANNSSGKVRIALIMSHMSNSFTTTLANSAKEQGAAAGVSVTVFERYFSNQFEADGITLRNFTCI